MKGNRLAANAKQPRERAPLPPCEEKMKPIKPEDSHVLGPSQEQPSIVIIGAGIAGLSAAAMLSQHGLTQVTVLEATERPGGRICSHQMGGVTVELGAQWIKGASVANSAFCLACQAGYGKRQLRKAEPRNCWYCTGDGKALDGNACLQAVGIFKKIEDEVRKLYIEGRTNEVHGCTLLDYLSMRIEEELHAVPNHMVKHAELAINSLVDELRSSYGDELSRVNIDMFGNRKELPGDSVYLPAGLEKVLIPLLQDFPKNRIHFNKPVHHILWGSMDAGPRALVTCCDNQQFPADYVIITVSLGVLKTQAASLFCPSLPSEKVNAIKNIGFGKLNKIYLRYQNPFWVKREGNLRLAWDPKEKENHIWFPGICHIDELQSGSNILCITLCGHQAQLMESCKDEDIASDFTFLLRRFTGDILLPFPKECLRSKWCSQSYFCGSGSYTSVNSDSRHRIELQTPLPLNKGACESLTPVLLFAGEATSPEHFGTVHGARETGLREASRILELTRKFQGPPVKRTFFKKS